MNVEYKRELTGNYCIIKKLKDEMEVLECGQQMLLNNNIPGFLKCQLLHVDDEIHFRYEITSKQSLKQLIEVKSIGFKELENIILGMLKIVASSKEYLLSLNHILFLPEFVYVNPETNEIFVCYCMMHEKELSKEFHKLIEYLLQKIDHKDEQAVMLGYEIYRKSLEENYALEQLLEIMKQSYLLKNSITMASQNKLEMNSFIMEEKVEKNLPEVELEQLEAMPEDFEVSRIQILWRKIWKRIRKKNVDQAETPYMALPDEDEKSIGNTVYFGDIVAKKQAKLVFLNGEREEVIYLDKDINVIGKMECCDIILKGNTVSRLHARIVRQEKQLWMEDLNSTNGTFLNGDVVGKDGVILQEQDKIMFGREEYTFVESMNP